MGLVLRRIVREKLRLLICIYDIMNALSVLKGEFYGTGKKHSCQDLCHDFLCYVAEHYLEINIEISFGIYLVI